MPWTLLESAGLCGVTWSWSYLFICAFYLCRGPPSPCQNIIPNHCRGLYRFFQPFSILTQYLSIKTGERTQLNHLHGGRVGCIFGMFAWVR